MTVRKSRCIEAFGSLKEGCEYRIPLLVIVVYDINKKEFLECVADKLVRSRV